LGGTWGSHLDSAHPALKVVKARFGPSEAWPVAQEGNAFDRIFLRHSGSHRPCHIAHFRINGAAALALDPAPAHNPNMKKKTESNRATRIAGARKASKASPAKVVAVKKAAQRPTHASRTLIRRVVRALAAASPSANA